MSDLLPFASTHTTLLKIFLAQWACSIEELRDLRVLQVYQCHDGFLVLIFLYGKYYQMFLDSHWFRFELQEMAYTTQKQACIRTTIIASMIGATLIEESEEETHAS